MPKGRQREGRGWPDPGQGPGPSFDGVLRRVRVALSRNRGLARALAVYAVTLSLLLLGYSWLDGTAAFHRFLEFNAQATGALVSLFDSSVNVNGVNVASGSYAVLVISECTIMAPLAIYSAAVLAVPAHFKTKVLGVALGFGVLSAVNLIRTTSLFFLGSAAPELMDVVHLLVWQSLMVLLAVGLWLLWMRRWVQGAAG